jgi:hypothetical protein
MSDGAMPCLLYCADFLQKVNAKILKMFKKNFFINIDN